MTKVLLKITIIVCSLAVCTLCSADVFDVYIAAGQSNMDGRGLYTELSAADLAAYGSVNPNIPLYYTNPGKESDGTNGVHTGWVDLGPGYTVWTSNNLNYTIPNRPLNEARFGPELSFGPAVLNSTTGRRVAIIKVSRGGTNLDREWDPSNNVNGPKGYMYANFQTAVPAALQALKNMGHSVELRGMIWHQGESDFLSPEAPRYEANLKEFIEVVRQDLGYPNLPFLIGELSKVDTPSDYSTIRTAQANVSASGLKYVELVSSAGLAVNSDGTHFTTSAVVQLGERFATTMASTISTVPGDYNRDGTVDWNDYTVWKTNFGSTTDARADGNNDGKVDAADYTIWRRALAVPEPSRLSLLAWAGLFGGAWLSRHRKLVRSRCTLNAVLPGHSCKCRHPSEYPWIHS